MQKVVSLFLKSEHCCSLSSILSPSTLFIQSSGGNDRQAREAENIFCLGLLSNNSVPVPSCGGRLCAEERRIQRGAQRPHTGTPCLRWGTSSLTSSGFWAISQTTYLVLLPPTRGCSHLVVNNPSLLKTHACVCVCSVWSVWLCAYWGWGSSTLKLCR